MSDFNILSFKPVTIKNFLSENNINKINNIINNKINNNINNNDFIYASFPINEYMGCFTYGQEKEESLSLIEVNQDIVKKIENDLNINVENLDLIWHRYSKKTGVDPSVGVHSDSSHEYHVLSFTVPINNNFIWDFYIEGKKYSLDNNEAVLFCVTEDLHWRSIRKFKDEETYDVIIGRFVVSGSKVDRSVSNKKDKTILKQQYIKLLRFIEKQN